MANYDTNALPGGAEVWQVDGQWYLVYDAPGTDALIMFRFERDEQREAAGVTRADRTLTRRQAEARGAIDFGVTSELDVSLGQHPWDSFLSRIERDAEIHPWLADPEVVAHVAGAWLRGVTPNLERTQWWQSRTDEERRWIERAASNPEQARQDLEDNRLRVREALRQQGLTNVTDGVLNFMADQMTMGRWSETYLQHQARRLTDRFAQGDLDPELRREIARMGNAGDVGRIRDMIGQVRRSLGLPTDRASDQIWADRITSGQADFAEALRRLEGVAGGEGRGALESELAGLVARIRENRGLDPDPESDQIWARRVASGQASLEDVRFRIDDKAVDEFARPGGFTQTREHEDVVRSLVRQWLGPMHGDWSPDEIARWAGRLRNDPNAAIELEEHLRGLRLAAFPGWTNPDVSYEQIASITRGMFQQLWGQSPDETDPLFLRIANMTDHAEATSILRREGWERGVMPVVTDAISGALRATGGMVRRAS